MEMRVKSYNSINGKLKGYDCSKCLNKGYIARRQYYLNSVRRDINPNARKMWAHYAASIHGNDWLKAMQQLFSRYAKEGR